MNRALVAGALGVIGRGLIEELRATSGWQALGLSRRDAGSELGIEGVRVDLLDADSCERMAASQRDITHLFYVAYAEGENAAAEIAPNLAMLANLMAALDRHCPDLRHVTLMQGTKAYGAHIGPYRTPAREDDPRIIAPLFYYPQEDHLRAIAAGKNWTFSIMRPRCLWGFSLNSPMNMITALAVYATISKRMGLPLCFPGTPGGYQRLEQAVDTRLLARACLWAAQEPRCAGETFNVSNGALFRWERMWPRIASIFGMENGPVRTVRLADVMADKAAMWDALVAERGLVPVPYRSLVDWRFADFQWHMDYDHISDTTKLARFGFHEIVDDEEMFRRQFAEMASAGLIPAPDAHLHS